MRGILPTNLENKEVLVQAELKIDLSKLWHYFFSRESWESIFFEFGKGGPGEEQFYFEITIKNRFFSFLLVFSN